MSPTEEVSLELMRQLRASAQLQHAWIAKAWQDERNLHPAAAMLLSDLAKHGESRPSELAKRRMVDVSVVSRQIAQLSAAGLIERRPAPEDGRAALVQVSEEGYRELCRWRGMHVDFIQRALAAWDDRGVVELTERITAMNEDLRDALGGAREVERIGKEGGL
ncbi:MarR family winged helix-turn-helix transcriptional regulator [Amycolatopsis nigrescens]|uniref:MarR family winged helix-turn-helix transcriptional regulator n=1 Tax=Amycolatopsis nigrescens TaxID=381445 RepID=UPI00037826F2|nr:MarR family winged helix-turn-helix transcriptional regulator [Amycolatopsis nigrescens]